MKALTPRMSELLDRVDFCSGAVLLRMRDAHAMRTVRALWRRGEIRYVWTGGWCSVWRPGFVHFVPVERRLNGCHVAVAASPDWALEQGPNPERSPTAPYAARKRFQGLPTCDTSNTTALIRARSR